jgi:hypothetical protein
MPRGARWAGLAAAAAVVALVTGIVISHARSGPPAVGANASAGTAIHEVPLGVTPDAVQVHSLQAVERASGTNYTARSVARVSPPDSRSPSSGSGSGGVAAGDSVPQGLSDLVSPQQMFSCISQLTTVPVVTVPLAVDFARYRGSPAAVVVLAEDATHDQVYVVGPRCGLPGAEGDLLLYQQLARH